MSFILDALKKSESERHRHSGPVLMDVRIAPPRRRLPTWAWIIAAVLLVNLLLLVWLLWRAPRHAPAPAAAGTAAVSPAPVDAPSAAPPTAVPTPVVPPAAAAVPPGVPDPRMAVPQPQTLPAPALPAPMPAPVPAQNVPAPQPVMSAPASPASNAAIDTRALPTVPELIAAGTALPELRLSLHVYDPAPANRYVLLNGARLGEGEFTRDGVKVVQITPAGAVLEWQGRRMFLAASG